MAHNEPIDAAYTRVCEEREYDEIRRRRATLVGRAGCRKAASTCGVRTTVADPCPTSSTEYRKQSGKGGGGRWNATAIIATNAIFRAGQPAGNITYATGSNEQATSFPASGTLANSGLPA